MRRAKSLALRALAACIAASLSSHLGIASGAQRGVPASGPSPSAPASSPPRPEVAAAVVGVAVAAMLATRLLAARGYLIAGKDEPAGFGAYGYLLLLAPPRDSERARHLSVLAAWLRQYSTVEEFLQNKVKPSEISLVQLPVRYDPALRPVRAASDEASLAAAEKLLEAYDYARAQAVAARLSLQIAGTGPILVTLTRPAGGGAAAVAVVENMSGVAPALADAWLRAAMNEALEPRTWSTGSLVRLALRMRNVVAQLAEALPEPQLRPDERVQLAQLAPR
nr:hypothetical protein [Caldimonas sp.]